MATSIWINSLLFFVGLLLILASLAANLLVIFALTFKKRTRLPAFNILMLGQTVISLMDIICNMPLTTASAYEDQWPLEYDSGGLHLCRFHAFFNSVISSTRVVLVALMALDRMVAIFSPINYPDRVTRERAWCMVIYCWLHAFAVYISMLAGATPVSYRQYHYSCLIASTAPESYVIVMVTFGYVVPVLFASIFLLMILKKYIVQEPAVSVVEDVSSCPQGDSSLGDGRTARKKLKNKGGYRSMSDYEVSGYVSVLFLLWLICQSPLFVTLTSDLILSKDDSLASPKLSTTNSSLQYNLTSVNNTNTTVRARKTKTANITVSNVTAIDTEVDKYQQMFPREFQTIVQFLNFLPTLVTPILTFAMYHSVWSRLKHVIAKSRFARRHHKALSIEDEDMSSAAETTTTRAHTFVQAAAAANRSRQRVRHRNRLAAECNRNSPETNATASTIVDASGGEKSDVQRPLSRLGTPVLMATSDGLLLHQVVRSRPVASNGDIGLEYVVGENGYFGNGESDADGGQVENDAMTSSCNSTKHLLHECEVVHTMEPIPDSKNSTQILSSPDTSKTLNGDPTNDSGIEDSPTAKPKNETTNELSPALPSHHGQFPTQPPPEKTGHSKATVTLVSPASASSIRPVLSNGEPSYDRATARSTGIVGPLFQQNSGASSQQVVSTIGEKAKNSVNLTVRRILGSASPKVKYRASVFTVASGESSITLTDNNQFNAVENDMLQPPFRERSRTNSSSSGHARNSVDLMPALPNELATAKAVYVNGSSSVSPYTSVFNSNADYLNNNNDRKY